jgi:EAL domain-containing protein (putative c-di-GMP-specific phosphodiesterase class I)
MYAAKSGAAGWRIYSEEMATHPPQVLTLATDLRDALAAGQIDIGVQPIVDLDSGAVQSLEALARWQHPTLGKIPPAEFVAAAERSGQVPALSARILDLAVSAAKGWHAAGLDLPVSVNLTPRWLAEPSLPEQIESALQHHGLPPGLLCLELTEGSVIAEPRRAAQTMARLRSLGVRLSVDDFGTGYSSLTHLSRLPVDQMKIDKTFVDRLNDSPRDRAIVQSIIDLGRNLGLQVVAEGVADPTTRRSLLEMGCRLAQGYLFSPPVTVAEAGRLLARVGVAGWPVRPAAAGAGIAPRPRSMSNRGAALPSVPRHVDTLAECQNPMPPTSES